LRIIEVGNFLNLNMELKMQQVDRNELAKANVAGGCCKSSCSTTTCKNQPPSGDNGGNPVPPNAISGR
jgi:hypothetical protein